ncbi:putative leader peptide [Kitasatospora paranensis]|uniref:putative leader peptide n=1 Tax=Kitasatospora paranensis TaxID=258053 RepID=UPI003CD08B18
MSAVRQVSCRRGTFVDPHPAPWNSGYVSQSESLVGRLHVDLRRHASAICAVCR